MNICNYEHIQEDQGTENKHQVTENSQALESKIQEYQTERRITTQAEIGQQDMTQQKKGAKRTRPRRISRKPDQLIPLHTVHHTFIKKST